MEDITSVQLLAELFVGCILGLVLACFAWLAFDSDKDGI